MNNHRIDVTGQMEATVKTNKISIQLQLVLTKATTSKNSITDDSGVQIHNIQLDQTEENALTEERVQRSFLQQ